MNSLLEYCRDTHLLGTYGQAVLQALATLLLGWLAAKIIRGILHRVMRRAKLDEMLVNFVGHMTYLALMTLVIVSAVGVLGVPIASFAAVLAAAGLAIGLALQGSLSNFAAGVMIIAFRPFRVGDYVEAGGVGGVVEEVQVFATKLRTPDNKSVIVPNNSITAADITNYSAKETRRVDLVFGIGYGDDLQKAKKVLTEIIKRDERVLEDPAPTIAVLELGDSSVNFAVRPWVKTADYWGVFFDVTEAVKVEFDRQGISIPFPQRDVHLHQVA